MNQVNMKIEIAKKKS